MLSVNYIYNFLEDKQESINSFYYNKIKDFESNLDIKPKKMEKYNCNLYESLNVLFNKNISNFYYNNRIYKNKSSVFTLLNSIFLIGNEYFNLNDESDKIIIMKDFLKKIDSDLFQKDYYTKYDYAKNRKFNKADLQEVLKDAYQFKSLEKINLLKMYLSDYLGINLYIFSIKDNELDLDRSEYYLTKYYGGYNKFLPNLILLYENEIYKPILINCTSSILKFSIHKELINNIWNYLKIEDKCEKLVVDEIINDDTIIDEIIIDNTIIDNNILNENDEVIVDKGNKFNINTFKNMKIDEIKKICEYNNIPLQKTSDKTNKMINKLKIELITELLKI